MKKSEQLKKKSSEADNDFRALALGKQVIREGRLERFEEKWLAKFKERFGDYIKYDEKLGAWRIKSGPDEYAFYPKANKVFSYSSNTWTEQGLKYLIKTFLNEKKNSH